MSEENNFFMEGMMFISDCRFLSKRSFYFVIRVKVYGRFAFSGRKLQLSFTTSFHSSFLRLLDKLHYSAT